MGPEIDTVFAALGARSTRASQAGREAGFSLIELVVVVAIVSVLAVGATIAVQGQRGPTDAARFQTMAQSAQALAIAGRARRGLLVGPRDITPMLWQGGRWTASGKPRVLRQPAVLTPVGGAALVALPNVPQLVFLDTGRSTAFALRFGDGIRCGSDGWTGVVCDDG